MLRGKSSNQNCTVYIQSRTGDCSADLLVFVSSSAPLRKFKKTPCSSELGSCTLCEHGAHCPPPPPPIQASPVFFLFLEKKIERFLLSLSFSLMVLTCTISLSRGGPCESQKAPFGYTPAARQASHLYKQFCLQLVSWTCSVHVLGNSVQLLFRPRYLNDPSQSTHHTVCKNIKVPSQVACGHCSDLAYSPEGT